MRRKGDSEMSKMGTEYDFFKNDKTRNETKTDRTKKKKPQLGMV